MDHDHNHDRACACGCDATPERVDMARRRLMAGAAGAAAASAVAVTGGAATAATDEARAIYADPDEPGLPQVDMDIASAERPSLSLIPRLISCPRTASHGASSAKA